MKKMFNKILATLLLFSAIVWFANAGQAIFDHSHKPDKFTLVVAFVITGCACLGWSVEAFNEE